MMQRVTRHLEDIVLVVGVSLALSIRLRNPKADIFVAGRVLGVGLKGVDPSVLKLTQESWVRGPEEANVGDREENHCEALQPETESPTHLVRFPRVDHHLESTMVIRLSSKGST
jgi:hypothetical protein